MTKLVDNWLNYAKVDLHTITKILDDPELTSMVAFHSQQCIEKSFKAVLLNETNKIPRVHNLISLNGTVQNYIKVPVNREILTMINELYIDSRYPAEIGLDGVNIPSIQAAKLFYDEAYRIYNFIINKLTE